jgi:ribose transport system permease protein
VLAIVALGLTAVLLAGEFDLSIAATVTFTGALSTGLVSRSGLSPATAFVLAIGLGLLVGLVNGLLVTFFRINSLIATLASSTLMAGLTLWYTNGETIFKNLNRDFTTFGRWELLGVQAPVIYALGLGVALATLLALTTTGRYLHAVGGNRLAARLSGVHVDRLVVLAFVVCGGCAGLAGVVISARNGSATPSAGDSLLLPAFAACFLGSATLRQGEFHVTGTLFSVCLIAVGAAGFVLLGAPFYTQQLFSGAVLILATASVRLPSRRRPASASSRGKVPATDVQGSA